MPSRETIDRLRSFDSLSSTLDHAVEHLRRRAVDRFEGDGGAAPVLAIAKESLAAPPLAQPPSPQAIASSIAAIAARGAVRQARRRLAMVSLIGPERYR